MSEANTPPPETHVTGEAWAAKAAVLRSRGKNNTLHDINQAADYLDDAAAMVGSSPEPSSKEPRCPVIGWTPLKKSIWDQVIAANLNGGKYISAWDLTDSIYAAHILRGYRRLRDASRSKRDTDKGNKL